MDGNKAGERSALLLAMDKALSEAKHRPAQGSAEFWDRRRQRMQDFVGARDGDEDGLDRCLGRLLLNVQEHESAGECNYARRAAESAVDFATKHGHPSKVADVVEAVNAIAKESHEAKVSLLSSAIEGMKNVLEWVETQEPRLLAMDEELAARDKEIAELKAENVRLMERTSALAQEKVRHGSDDDDRATMRRVMNETLAGVQQPPVRDGGGIGR